jgi:hypothetical protein
LIDARHSVQLDLLVAAQTELPLTAVPGAVEDHRLGLLDVQPPLRIEPRLDAELCPVQSAGAAYSRHNQHQKQKKNSSTSHYSGLQSKVQPF